MLLSAISRWIHHDREERSKYFNELVKMIRFEDISSPYIQFMFTKLCLVALNAVLTQILEPIGYSEDSVLQEDTTSLYVLVEYPEEKFMKVYSINSALECSSIFDCNHEYDPSKSWLYNVTLNSYLYCLHYCFFPPEPQDPIFDQTFCAYTSISNSSELRLKSSSLNFSAGIDLCAVKNNTYAYYPCISNIANPKYPSNLFNEEELKRGVYVYNCEVDDWFPVPRMRKQMEDTCVTSQDDLLYVIGGCSLDGSTSPGYAQMYDFHLGEWQELPKTHYRYKEAACCSMNEIIYVVGGLGETRVGRYDPRAGRWENMTEGLHLQKKIISHRLVPHLGKLYIMGGFSTNKSCGSSFDLSIDLFNVESCTWYTSSILTDDNKFHYGNIVDAVIFKS